MIEYRQGKINNFVFTNYELYYEHGKLVGWINQQVRYTIYKHMETRLFR